MVAIENVCETLNNCGLKEFPSPNSHLFAPNSKNLIVQNNVYNKTVCKAVITPTTLFLIKIHLRCEISLDYISQCYL